MNLVPIKVRLGLRANGHCDHPDWFKLPLAATENPADHMPTGWHYDKTCGHKESSVDSPYGGQWGMLFVTPQFAKEAKAIFPDLITELTETEAEDFWNNKVYAHVPENRADANLLQALKNELILRKELGEDVTELKAKIAKALDPNDVEPGLRKDYMKKFVDAKQHLGFTVVASK